MRTQPHDDPATLRFRGATLDEAIELAEQSLGPRTRVVAANHIRRGGIGGFFASDLGVEVSVVLDDETIEAALDRIVEETAAQEREQWRDRVEPETITPAAPFVPVEIPAAASSFAAALRRVEEPTIDTPVEQQPVEQQRVEQPLVSTPSLGTRIERLEAAFASLRANDPPVPVPVRAPGRVNVATPSRRQVELVVAATDQLIESIAARGCTEQLSVRVVMRGSTGAEVEAEARWGSGQAR